MSKKVLLVDDEPDIVKIVSVRLKQWGYEVVAAQNGAEGLQMAASEKPDLILLDVMLGDTTGFEVCKKIRENFGDDIKVVIYTAKIDGVDAARAREAGTNDFTVKTGDMVPLKEAIEKHI